MIWFEIKQGGPKCGLSTKREKLHLSFILFAEVGSSRGWSYMKEARDVKFEVRKIKVDVNIVS